MSSAVSVWSAQSQRWAQLIVSKGSTGLDLSRLRFRFEVNAADVETPNTLIVRVYNLADETRNRVIAEFDTVTLSAGYVEGPKGIIFQGDIKQFFHGLERNVDKFLEIRAGDGDKAYNSSVINVTLPAGVTDQQQLAVIAEAMGIPVAQTANGYLTTGGILPRGKTMWGMAREEMTKLARKNKCRWSIQNGQIVLVPDTGYLPGQAIAINSASGMIGTPEQTDNGILVRCLLNPAIRVGQAVQINNRDINQAVVKSQSWPSYTSQYYPATTSDDGLYRVLVVEHYGDTRGSGNDFYTELVCLDIDRSAPASKSVLADG